MTKIPVIFEGKNFILLYQYSSGYCEISEVNNHYRNIKLVHISELELIKKS